MKKQNLLKLALVSIAMMVFTGAQAQYAASILTDYENVAETIYQTESLNFTLYAHPDPVYHPDYDAVTNTGFNTISQWLWKYGADWATGTDIGVWSANNYVEVAASWGTPTDDVTPSTRTFYVKERFNVASACESATDQSKTVAVVAQPEITAIVGTNVSGSWNEDVAGTEYSYCDDGLGLADNLSITITEFGSLLALREYTYGITVSQTAYDGNLVALAGFPQDVTATYGQTYDLAAMVAGYAQTFTVPANMMLYDDAGTPRATKYEFTVTANSLGSLISRVSQYRHDDAVAYAPYNNVPATVITYWLYPTPTTGPIYHIPNNYAF